ncbi:hypothetical protein HK100_002657 [Physocladia obscura]|uniref:SET domain-containing protein n=1 Tax=Physocladia obscura TaxID=109957 RepID=A0AAD5T128_9FUNG|nr:hypothetical protein HK100_002657 [Physocladia obscura]
MTKKKKRGMKRSTDQIIDEAEKRVRAENLDKQVDCADTLQLQQLIEWAESHGANLRNLRIETDTRSGLRGAVATARIARGDHIASLSPRLILSETTARTSLFGQTLLSHLDANPQVTARVTGSTDLYAKQSIVIAAFLAYEMWWRNSNDGPSFWSPYLQTLPKNYDLPLQWPQHHVDVCFRATNLQFMAAERRRMISDAVDLIAAALQDDPEFTDVHISFDQLAWGYSTVVSRAFPKGTSLIVDDNPPDVNGLLQNSDDGGGRSKDPNHADKNGQGSGINLLADILELCLYPVLDMESHSFRPSILKREKSSGTIANGSKGNENLLSNYGFTITPNPEDYAKISLQILPSSTHHTLRISTIATHAIPTVHLLFISDTALAKSLILATKILVGNPSEIAAVLGQINKDPDSTPTEGRRLDLLAYATLFGLVAAKRDAIRNGTVIIDSEEQIAATQDEELQKRLQMANIYRTGQINIFDHTLKLIEQVFKKTLCLDNSNTIANPFEAMLTIQSGRQTGLVLDAISSFPESDPESGGVLDQETILNLIIMYEASIGRNSEFFEFFNSAENNRSLEDAKNIMSDQVQDILNFFSESVLPTLQSSDFFKAHSDVFTSERFVWASSFLDTHGLILDGDMLRGMDLAEFLDNEDDEAVFGIVLI